MANPWEKDFDTILNEILTDYQNQAPDIDVSQATLMYIKSACIASAIWGLYRYQDWIKRQITPDTAARDILERHASVRGITYSSDDTDEELLEKLLSVIRQPPAGGNRYDWPRWAKDVSYEHAGYTETVKDAKVYEKERGVGSIDLAITSDRSEANGGEEEATTELVSAVSTYIDGKRPLGAWDRVVRAAQKLSTDVTMTVTGDSVTAAVREAIAADVEEYMKGLSIGEPLYQAKLIGIAIDRGGKNATLTAPASDVTPTEDGVSGVFQRVWPGTVTVS